MQSLHYRDSRVVSASVLLALGLALTACSSSSSPPAPSSSTPPATSSSVAATPSAEPQTGSGAIAAIEANWAAFFDAKTPIARRVSLLQNGPVFAPVIRAQAGSALAQAATSKVTHVTLSGTSQAYVTYEILVGGKPALSGQQGVAVYDNGVWKVGAVSFCALLKLENGGKTQGLFPACKS